MIERQRTFLQSLFQRLPVEVLHDEEVGAVRAADIVNCADVRMAECGECFRLTLEAVFQLGIGSHMFG